jgi:hypothetical protein
VVLDSFERDIEKGGVKLQVPQKAASIDRAVAEFKERNSAGEFHDWEDTMLEFVDAAMKPAPRPHRNCKRTGDKR